MTDLIVWAPNAKSVELVHGDPSDDHKGIPFNPPINMTPTSVPYKGTLMGGYWHLPPLPNFPLNDGDPYWYKIEFQNGDPHYRIDPYARAMRHSKSYSIYKNPHTFNWTDQGFKPPTFESMIIYQIFQGAYEGKGDGDWINPDGNNYHFIWNVKKKGDFIQLKNKLDYIQSLGINAIELLPVNEYDGDDFLGYSSVSFFAIESSYGHIMGDGSSYDDLKIFINEAHSRGIAVIADVVFNHFGHAGDSGPLWNYDSEAINIYVSSEQAYDQEGGSFGNAPNWYKYEVQKYIEDSCIYYLDELHFDGLRFDFTSQIINKFPEAGPNSGREVLRDLIWKLKQQFPQKIMICEHWDERLNGNYNVWMIQYENFDAGWFNYRRRMQDVLWPYATGKEGDLADAINGGNYVQPYNRIVYANNHDECWWDGGPNHGKYYPVSEFNGWRGDYWSQKKARMMYSLSFFIPGIPMFFMGDEFAMEGEFNDSRWDNILNWGLEKIVPGPSFLRMFKELTRIKKTFAPLMQPDSKFDWLWYPPRDGWFAFKRKRSADVLIVTGNYSGNDMYAYRVDTHGETGNWSQIFNSDGQEFGGNGVGNYGNNPNSSNGYITINIPRNGIVVMNRTSI